MISAPRLTSRAVGLLALALAAITCSDAPTAPSSGAPRPGHLALAPSFSAGASRSYETLTGLGFDIASARVRLTTADGAVATDTVVSFPAASDTLQLDLVVDVHGGEETFMALIELRDATGLVLFAGSRLVTARASALPGAAPAAFKLEYAGPGRGARTLLLSPTPGPVSATGAVSLSASALDSAGRPIGDLLVRWTTSDTALGSVTATGSASAELRGAGKRGTVVVSAATPTGLGATTTIALVPPPARLVVEGGDAQQTVAGRALPAPFEVRVQASDGGPVPGVAVQFRAATAGGSVATASATSDANGRASTRLAVGKRTGAYTFESTSGSLAPVSVVATASAPPPTSIALASGNEQRERVGAPLSQPLTVLVTDELGDPAAGATVQWSVIDGSGTLGAASTTTGSDGRAEMSYVLGRTSFLEHVRATLAGVEGASVDFTVRGDPGAAVSFQLVHGLPSAIQVGVPPNTALEVQLVDDAGNPVSQSGVIVTATGTVTPGNRPPFVVSATTDGTGMATFALPAYAGALGNATVTLTSPGLAPLTLPTVTFVTGPAKQLRLATAPSVSSWSGVALPAQPVVQLADAGDNDVAAAGVTITVFVASGGGTLTGATTAVTDATGKATFTGLAIVGSAGHRTLGFSSPSLRDALSNQIDLADAPAALAPVAGALAPTTATGTALLSAFKVQLVDASGQPVAGAGMPITISASSLTGGTPSAPLTGTLTRLTDASGVATFDDVSFAAPAGTYLLTATSDPAVLALPVLTLVAALTLN